MTVEFIRVNYISIPQLTYNSDKLLLFMLCCLKYLLCAIVPEDNKNGILKKYLFKNIFHCTASMCIYTDTQYVYVII